MQFAAPIPWWAVGLVAAAVAAVAFWSYRRPLAPLSGAQRWTLTALRALALGLVVLFLCRPVILLPPVADRDLVVPVLVDVSRSMRIADADGATRLARAAEHLRAGHRAVAGWRVHHRGVCGRRFMDRRPASRLPAGRQAKQPGRSGRRDPRTLSRAPGAWHRADFRRRDHRERRGSRRRRAAVHDRRRVGRRTKRPRGRRGCRQAILASIRRRSTCVCRHSAAATAVHRFSCASWQTAACSSRET